MMTKPRPTPINRQHIGPNVRAMRQDAGLTLDDLAEQADISASHLSRLERGQTMPSFTVLAGIAAALEVSLDEFSQLENENVARDTALKAVLAGWGWTLSEVEMALDSDDLVKNALLKTAQRMMEVRNA